jgi:hypothetical protein
MRVSANVLPDDIRLGCALTDVRTIKASKLVGGWTQETPWWERRVGDLAGRSYNY